MNKTFLLERALFLLKQREEILEVGSAVLQTHRGHRDKLSLWASFNRDGVRVENDYPLTIQGLRQAFKAIDPNSDYNFTVRK